MFVQEQRNERKRQAVSTIETMAIGQARDIVLVKYRSVNGSEEQTCTQTQAKKEVESPIESRSHFVRSAE